MTKKDLIIVGIDPGTTLGYAVLDLNGDVIEKDSSKSFNLNSLIKKVIQHGRVLAVGCDKKSTPSFVKQFATKVGAKLIHPYNDLKVEEKKKLAEHRIFYDDHQMDAIASAIFAFKEIKGLIKKVELYTERNRCEDLFQDVVELTVKQDMSVVNAVDSLKTPSKKPKVKKRIRPTKVAINLQPPRQTKLESKFRTAKGEKEQLEKKTKHLEHEKRKLESKLTSFSTSKRFEQMTIHKEDKIRSLQRDKRSLQKKVTFLKKIISTEHSILSNLNQGVLLKRLDNLSQSELSNKDKILNIQEGDVLLVEDPNVYSQRSIESLKKVSLVLFRKQPAQKTKTELNFVFIDASKMKIIEDRYFAVINKKELDKNKSSDDLLDKLIKEHKKR